MDELLECAMCKSMIRRDQIDGQCFICERRMCEHCKLVCSKCKRFYCFNHASVKLVMRQGSVFSELLCDNCKELW